MEGHAIALPTVSGETSAKMAAAHETGGIPWKPESSPARSTYTPECRERGGWRIQSHPPIPLPLQIGYKGGAAAAWKQTRGLELGWTLKPAVAPSGPVAGT